MNKLPTLCLALSALIIQACSTSSTTLTEEAIQTKSQEKSTTNVVELPVKPFSTETLYDLLVGDLALIRGQFELGLENYLHQARETGDSAVIEIANRAANHVRNPKAIQETAALWMASDPNNAKARKAALQAAALRGDVIDALTHAHWLYAERGDVEAFLSVTSINEGKKQDHIPGLISAYETLPLSKDKRPMIHMAVAILYRENNQFVEAEAASRRLLATRPDNERGLLLLSQILHQQDKTDEGTDVLRKAVQRLPDSRKLRLQYARYLIQTNRPEAIAQFQHLVNINPRDYETSFMLGLLLLDQKEIPAAIQHLENASSSSTFRSDAQYHLGTVAEQQQNSTKAIIHYRQVLSGRNFLSAATRASELMASREDTTAARMYLQKLRSQSPSQSAALYQVESNLLIKHNQSDTALSILTDGLASHPKDIQLLYARSLLAEKQDRFDIAEQDLRDILSQDANNATALNALGYALLIHTDRYEEASELIKRAYALQPNDPAIIDSMGWALFRLGHLEQALAHLKKAMAILPDPEIAAHLGEVQWLLGDRSSALQSWQKGLLQDPNHETILETMHRLGADPAKLTTSKDN